MNLTVLDAFKALEDIEDSTIQPQKKVTKKSSVIKESVTTKSDSQIKSFTKKMNEDLSWGEVVFITDEWEKYKKSHNGYSDPGTAWEFIETLGDYTESEKDDIFGLISAHEDSLNDVNESCENKKLNKSKKLIEKPVYSLEPRYDARKSFYGKAQVDVDSDKNKLYSYDTLVAEIKDGKPVVYGTYSQTTLRHIKEWLKQLGFKAENSKQIMADYGVKQECKETLERGVYKNIKEQRDSKDHIILTADDFNGKDDIIFEGNEKELEKFLEANNIAFYPQKNKYIQRTMKESKVNSRVKKSKLKESETFNLNDEEDIAKAKETLNKAKSDDNNVEQIVDVDAETIDELKDSYVGNAILQCQVCKTLIYKKPEALVRDEENDKLFNVEDECPHCGAKDGYELVGQVATMDVDTSDAEEESETTGSEVEEPVDEPVEDENNTFEIDTEEETFESFDTNKFNRLVNKYVRNIYENVENFETTSAMIDDDNNKLFVEGIINYKNGKKKETKFVFEGVCVTATNKYRFKGINETFSKGRVFTLTGSIKNKTLKCESLKYNYKTKVMNESKTIKGTVSLVEKKLKK